MKFVLDPTAPNGIRIQGDVQTALIGVGGSSSGVPDISYGNDTPVNGVDTGSHFYYDLDDSTLYVYVNGIWYPISGGTPPTQNGADIFGLLLTRNLQ